MGVVKFLLLLLLFHIHLLKAAESKCPESFRCGDFSLQFPLTQVKNPNCGLIAVDGCDPEYLNPTIRLGGLLYTILAKNSTNKFLVRSIMLDAQLNNHSCFSFMNQSLLQSPSISFSFSPNITVFPCETDNGPGLEEEFFQNYGSMDCGRYRVYYKMSTTDNPAFVESNIPQRCYLIQLPIKSSYQESRDLFNVLTSEFTLEWNVLEECNECYRGGGQCLTDDDDDQFYCSKGDTKVKRILFVAGLAAAALACTLIIIFAFIWRTRAKTEQEHEKDIELFIKKNGNLAPIRYKYSSIKKMTKSFSENLGRGGYGIVYKGKLPNGHPVAVKILNEPQGNGEEFMNEVASISRTSHINIITLLGFCIERSKRALIYDFMPNGSLDKFIQETASSEGGLGHQKLFEIALGIARGLEYLHQGCNMRILHFDIKPHNILLDKDLNPRISDFGLAKLCPNRSSIVSMLVARGTAGYIAPEVFCRSFGDVTYKADVYSFGMMVLEMVGGRENINRGDVCNTSETHFPHYIYKQFDEMDAETNGGGGRIVDEDEREVAKRKLIIVGLWCIQTIPKDRPSMTKVVEMLEGEIGTLQFPPKPYLFSS